MAFGFGEVFEIFGVLYKSHQTFKDVIMYWKASGLGILNYVLGSSSRRCNMYWENLVS